MDKYEDFKKRSESISLPKLNKKEPAPKKKFSIIKKQNKFLKTFQLHVDFIEKLDDLHKELNSKIKFYVSKGRILETLINEADAKNLLNSLKKDNGIDN